MQADRLSQDAASAQMGQIMDEYLDRANAGERPRIDEYAERYPELADVIRKMLPTLEVMQMSACLDATNELHTSHEIRPEGPLGDFRIVRELGRGGMGVVYEATQISLGRTVALKVLPFAAAMDDRQLQRFKNEAQAAASLHHPHIVPVFGVGCERGVHYYAMQLIEGQTLATVIGEVSKQHAQKLPPNNAEGDREAVADPQAQIATQAIAALSTAHSTNSREYFRSVTRLIHQIATALDHAHQAGIIHRDVKPANLILDQRGEVWITDFGLAQVQSDARLTMTGDLMGTLRYMSPEQALAKRVTVDHRTDIYSLGATLYELLTLQPCFSGADREELLRQIAFEETKPARRVNHAIPVELETIVMKAMAKNPAERYTSAEEFADDLQRFIDDRPITARRPTLVQHVSRWTRRHRGVAVTIAIAMSCALVGLGISTAIILGALADKSKFVEQLQDEKEKTEELLVAETKAKERETKVLTEVTKARDDLAESVRLVEATRQREQITISRERRNAFDHEIMLANVSEREGNHARSRSVLLGTRPEFRNLEWNYLTRKAHDARFSFDGALMTTKLSNRARRIYLSPQGDYLAVPVLPEAPTGFLGSQGALGGRQKVGIAFISAQTGKTIYVAAPDDSRRMVNGRAKVRGDISCAFAPNSAQAAVAILGKRISVVDLSEQRELFSLEDHEKDVTCLSFSPDGKWLASGSEDKTVRIWDMQSKKCVRVYKGHNHAIRKVAFCPDGSSRIVSQSGGNAQKTTNKAYMGAGVEPFISDKGGFRVKAVLDGYPAHEAGLQVNDIITKVDDQGADQIQHFAYHFSSYAPGDQVKLKVRRGEEDVALEVTLAEPPDWEGGRQGAAIAGFLTRQADVIHVWDASSGELAFPEINGQFQSWSPNGEFLAHTRWRRYAAEIVIIDADGAVVIQNERFGWAQFHPNSQRVLLGSEWQTADSDGGLEEWDLSSGDRLKEIYPPFEYLKFATYVLDGTHILVANWRTTRVDVVDANSGRIIGGRRIARVDEGGAFLVDPTGRYFTMQIPTSREIAMWDVHSWIEQKDSTVLPGDYQATNVAAGPHGTFIAIANKAANSVDILDANSAALVHRLPVDFPVNESTSKHLLFDASGKQVAIVGQHDPVRFHAQAWNISNQKTILSQRTASGVVKSVAFYDQELRVLVQDKRRWQVVDTAKDEFIWELPEWSASRAVRGRPIVVQDGQLTSSGEKVVFRNSHGACEIWDINKDERDLTLSNDGYRGIPTKDWVSPNGKYVLAYPSRGPKAICDVRTGEQHQLDQLGAVRIAQYHWSQDEQRLLVVARNESWLIDVTTGRELLALQHRRPLISVDFSFGQRILAVTDKGRVNVWNGTELTSDTPQHAGLLADLAWNIVLDPNSGTEKVLRALELAQEARDRSVGVAKYDYILGAAHYRAGNHRVAAETLASLSLHHALWVPPRNARFLRFLQRDDQYRWFLAMAQWKLGEKELAKDIFDATYLTIVEDERLRSLADEAAQLLGTSFDQKLQDEQDQRNRFADEFRRSGFRGQQRSPSELAAVLIAARDQDGDETISEDEMRDLMRPRFPEFDIDKSGELDREELITMFERSALTGPTGARQTDWLLRNLEPVLMSRDSNGDGVVTEEESPPFLWRLYGLHDANGDGKLELDEVRKSLEAAAAKQDE